MSSQRATRAEQAAELLELCLAGDERAWSRLYAWCRDLAAAKLPREAEDAAQQVCLKLLNGGLEAVREPKAFFGYVRRAVSNEVISRLRKTGREVSLDRPLGGGDEDGAGLLDVMDPGGHTPEEQAGARLALQMLAGLIAELPAYCEGVMGVYIRYRMGLLHSYKEMADVMDVPVNTISVQIKRCLDRLRTLPGFGELAVTLEA